VDIAFVVCYGVLSGFLAGCWDVAGLFFSFSFIKIYFILVIPISISPSYFVFLFLSFLDASLV